MKRILITSTYFHPYLSGLTDYPLKIASELAKKHHVTVLTFQHDKKLTRRSIYEGVTIIRVPVQLRIFKGLWNFSYPFISLSLVFQSDIVFINLPQFEGSLPAFFARILGKKVYCIYNCELMFKGFFAQVAAFVGNASAFATCFFSQTIIAYTNDYATHSPIIKYFLYKTVAIPPPVAKFDPDPRYLSYLHHTFSKNKPIIGFSGRIAREKGVEFLIKALLILQKDYPKTTLLLAGPYGKDVVGEEKYYEEIMHLIHNSQLRVTTLGTLNKSQLASFYQVIDVLVLPSINKTEAFGMVQLESMYVGTPVVSSNLPGVRVPITKTRGGLLVEPANSKELARKIKQIVQNKKWFQKNALQALQLFNIHKTYTFYENLVSR